MRISFNDPIKRSSLTNNDNGKTNNIEEEFSFDRQKPKSNKQAPPVRKGRCINFGECEEAGKLLEVPKDEDFVCPSCRRPLEAIAQRSVKRSFIPLWAAGAVVSLALVFIFLFTAGKSLFSGSGGLFNSFVKKPTGLQAEEAVKAQLPRGFDFIDIKEKTAVKDQDGNWIIEYDVTVRPNTALYWVPVGPILPGKERLEAVPKDLKPWAKSHLKDLLFTLDQEPGMTYYQDQKRTAFEANQDLTFSWKTKAVEQPDKSWKFLNQNNTFPWNQLQEVTAPGVEKIVLRNAFDLSSAMRQEESQWTDYANRLRDIDKQAAQAAEEARSGISGPGRKPKFLQPGTGGPTTAAEGAAIGAGGGALIGGLAGGPTGAGWGALGGVILGGLGGGLYSYEKEKKIWRARVAAYHAAVRRAEARAREEKEKLLEQYAQELRQNAENRRLALSGFNPSSPYSPLSPQQAPVPASIPPAPPVNIPQPPPFASTPQPAYPGYPQTPVAPPGGYGPPAQGSQAFPPPSFPSQPSPYPAYPPQSPPSTPPFP